ncbi:VOC family protein [Candidatus Falkowbacteria bacterium]|nr:VOC family protein [Candidatus Falkowbacteria bacterium]
MKTQKITTHLWYDKEAKEAAEFYVSIFKDSKINNVTTIHDTPSGDADIVDIELAGQVFNLISAGPYFKFTPAVSLLVACDTKEEVDALWGKLYEGGSALMELGKYPFSDWYGWLQDKYGLSWQIMLMGEMKAARKITPTMMFVGDVAGKAEEAINFYASIFSDSKIGGIMRYGKGEEPDKEGTIKHASFELAGLDFAAMDSAWKHEFNFSEAISFVVHCETQEEIDHYWNKLSAVPEAEQCGWLKDKYGFSWQIVPTAMEEMMKSGDGEKMARVTQAFLKMKKFDIAKLQEAYEGK